MVMIKAQNGDGDDDVLVTQMQDDRKHMIIAHIRDYFRAIFGRPHTRTN